MNTILTLRYNRESFDVSICATNTDKVQHLINWITEYKHGIYDSYNSKITCDTRNDFISCRKKAKSLGLISVKNIQN